MNSPRTLQGLIKKLEQHSLLEPADREAILAMPLTLRTLDPNSYIVREGEPPQYCCILLTGFAYRHKVTGDGGRQIMSIHMPGDFVDLQNSYLDVSDHNVQLLTRADVAFVARPVVRQLADDFPNVARAFWTDTLVDASIFREWVMNVGRRDSLTRIAHLLCEFTLRLDAAGLADGHSYELPMTQEQLADATGLTSVHVNRVLKQLGQMNLIERNKRSVKISDWDRLSRVGDFSARYLHLDYPASALPSAAA